MKNHVNFVGLFVLTILLSGCSAGGVGYYDGWGGSSFSSYGGNYGYSSGGYIFIADDYGYYRNRHRGRHRGGYNHYDRPPYVAGRPPMWDRPDNRHPGNRPGNRPDNRPPHNRPPDNRPPNGGNQIDNRPPIANKPRPPNGGNQIGNRPPIANKPRPPGRDWHGGGSRIRVKGPSLNDGNR